ncbi:MAG: hypothetical protein L7U87_03770, partial [Chlamydiales bacterium]|nr:hypothetical protein [Chlamydiales bacterium]
YLLEKMGFPIEKLSATPQSSQLKSCFSKLAEVGKAGFKARVVAVAKAVRIEIASLDELEKANPQMSQRLDKDIAPLFTKFLASFRTKFCDVKECEELSLTPISDTSDIWKVLKRFFLLKISQHSSKGTPLAAIENILKTSNSLSTAFFYLKHGIIYSISSNANSFFFKGQRQASFSQEHLLFTLLDSDGTRLLFHPNTNKGIEQGSNFYLESFFENKEVAQNFSLVDLFLKPEIIFEGYMLREKDLPFLRISQILWSPLIDLKEMQTATSQFFASGSDMQRLSLVAHLDEFYPSFTPSDDWEEKKLYLAYLGYLKAAEVFITEKERAAIEQLPIGSSHQRVHVGIAATIIQHVIPFLEGLTYPSTANTITRKLQEYCLDTFEDDEQISNTFMFMLRLAELKNSSTALENLIEHYIKPKLGADHPSSECFKAAFQWVQGIKVTAEEQMSANLSRETEELDEEVAAVAKAVDRDELFSEIKSLVASPIRSGMFAALLAKLAPFPELRAIELPDNLQTASGSQYTIARLEEDALAILEELKGLTDRKDADISSGSSTSKESNSDDSHTLEKPVSILEFITEEDEGELLHTIKLLIIEHMKNKNIAKLSFSTQRIFEAILSQLQDHFFYYQSTDERLGNKTHIGIATQDNSSLNNERSALFRALLRAPIQELYQFAEYSNPIEKDLLALDKIAPSFNPSLAQAITGVFEGVLGPIIFKAVSEEDA